MNNPTSSGTDYVPISCDTYSELELAILQQRKVRLVWAERNVLYDQIVHPLDLKTVAHEEFLLVRLPDGEQHTIRLDSIRRLE